MNKHISRWPTEKMKLCDHFLEVISKAQKKYREECKGTEWVEQERNTMFEEVNRQRGVRGLPSVLLKDLMKAETMVCGHFDYSSKFALYCAELVLDDPLRGTP